MSGLATVAGKREIVLVWIAAVAPEKDAAAVDRDQGDFLGCAGCGGCGVCPGSSTKIVDSEPSAAAGGAGGAGL
ncbi:MAG TPA: hypothetical protein VOA87_15205, partial [Thermoanaerobaculia bacterium]|nr:hypothetical protein [Thermoanaerobaculia bacterium]